MEPTLKTLMYKRTQIKSQITRFKTFLQSNYRESELEPRFKRFEGILDDFNVIQSEIELLTDPKSPDEDERRIVENLYFSLVSEVDLLRKDIQQERIEEKKSFYADVKLPAISIQKYNGDIDKWIPFKESFMCLVDQNGSLNNLQRFQYLISSLVGDPSKLISSLNVTEDNYQVALKLLENRYQNNKLIINHHLKAIFTVKAIKSENYIELRTIIDETRVHLQALKKLNLPTEYWDILIIYLIANKLDFNTRNLWESYISTNEIPTWNDFTTFIERRAQVLETMSNSANQKAGVESRQNVVFNNNYKGRAGVTLAANQTTRDCTLCHNVHDLYFCKRFRNLEIDSRREFVRTTNLCFNCLKKGHGIKSCRSTLRCKFCKGKHNELLHSEVPRSDARVCNSTAVSSHTVLEGNQYILLSTVVVKIQDNQGRVHQVRALLDSGSQSSFVTTGLCRKLKLKGKKLNVPITGIHNQLTNIKEVIELEIESRHSSFRKEIGCLILDKITQNLPQYTFEKDIVKIPVGLQLADENYNRSGPIDMLLGADVFWDVLNADQIRLGGGCPILQRTELGWIVSGPVALQRPRPVNCCNLSMIDMHNLVEKFWKMEEVIGPKHLSIEEQKCEEHFVQTNKCNQDGRYQVNLPFRDNVPPLGDTLNMAKNRLISMEKKFERNHKLGEEYSEFMDQYKKLGHMTPCEPPKPGDKVYYLPHHAVFKDTSTTTKIRVVFDGSAKPANGIALNEALMVGPVIQRDLFSHLICFRKYQHVMTADIAKMYRQINVADEDRNYQRVLWKKPGSTVLQHFQLNTVTYGLAPSSFLATRVLKEIGMKNLHSYPLASNAILRNFYMDDLLTGSDSSEECFALKQDLCSLMATAGMELRKWRSNIPAINDRIDPRSFSMDNDDYRSKILGLLWDSREDIFAYRIHVENDAHVCTKRSILSHIAQMFDPIGLLGPLIIQAKLIMQSMWQLKLDWDETVPYSIKLQWQDFLSKLDTINQLQVPRRTMCRGPTKIELHGFCDASEKAYGACIYVRTTDSANIHHVNLICAKSRVAPLKRISLPRLELCAAHLLVKLMDNVSDAFEFSLKNKTLWSDSTIALNWIAGEPYRWNTFVANRVAEIQRIGNEACWRHVVSEDNPADDLTRGLPAPELLTCQRWWKGPHWLASDEQLWPPSVVSTSTETPEKRREVCHVTVNDCYLLNRFSSLYRLKRVTAYLFRFCRNARRGNIKITGTLSVSELDHAMNALVKIAQSEQFSKDMKMLATGKTVSNASKCRDLNPFLLDGIMCVGGRLTNAHQIPYGQRHPIILPAHHVLTKLLIRNMHYTNFHLGPRALLSLLRLKYWPISGINAVKGVIRRCVVCVRSRPLASRQIMGDLPTDRLTPRRPFSIVGIDYAGPFMMKMGHSRNSARGKAYIALMVCFVTKAVHLEVVTTLTTDAFMNALKRFISRRGLPTKIYSDNATNFTSANREIKQLFDFINNSNAIIHDYLANMSVDWVFLPPRSPHMGGLWESAVKSVKQPLKRVLGACLLNYEGLSTLLTQIEAMLNSRPLSPLSSDPNDLNPLTPGHFLIGNALLALPEPNLQHIPCNRLNHYQQLISLVQSFWSRWRLDYLAELQKRVKWMTPSRNLEAGDMVVLGEPDVPPQKWLLGRIHQVHPGLDGKVRVATVKTSKGMLKRAITKLYLLPIDDQEVIEPTPDK